MTRLFQETPMTAAVETGSGMKPSFRHLEQHQHFGLSHDYGSGAPCIGCGNCSGLELHYWRKICKVCGCRIDSHDIPAIEHKHCDIVVCSLMGGVHDHFDSHKTHIHEAIQSKKVREAMNFDDRRGPVGPDVLKKASRYWSTSEDSSSVVSGSGSEMPASSEGSVTSGSGTVVNQLDQIEETFRTSSFLSSSKDVQANHLQDSFRRESNTTDSISNVRSMDYSYSVNNNVVLDHSEDMATQTNTLLMKDWNQTEEAQQNCRQFVENAKKNHFGVAKSIQCDNCDLPTPPAFNPSHPPQQKTSEFVQKTVRQFSSKETATKQLDPCKKCGSRLEDGEAGIFASRGEGVFHKDCFRCSKCENLLDDLLYFFKNDRYLCGRHFGEENYPRCGGCDELIFTREYTEAEGQSWHNEHFCCSKCDKPLGGMKYVHEKGQQYCFQCHSLQFNQVCSTCKTLVQPDEGRLSHKGYTWHNKLDCFRCTQCGSALVSRKFVFKEGNTFCSFQCKQVYETQC